MKFSIITVSFNSQKTIKDAIESVLSQDYPNIEYIIVDGGSNDGTLEIVQEYGDKITKVISESDSGIYDAMNKGISVATGDIIGFINSDDFYATASALSAMAAAFNNDVDVCYSDLCYVSQNDPARIVRYWKSRDFTPKLFESGWCPPHPTFFVRRSIYQRLGGFDLSFKIAADFELMARFLEVERVRACYIPQVLVHMRVGGTTNRSLANIFKQNIEIRRALIKHRLKFSLLKFLTNKLLSRTKQFIIRPTS